VTKIKVGFFSFTEITDPNEHHAYNEWHMLDHMPEQFPIPGIAFGQRWVSTPACRAVRTASDSLLDPIHYVTLYLMTEPVDETLREFRRLGGELREKGRFHLHRQARLSGPFALAETAAAARVLVSPEAVPYRPHYGVHVQVQTVSNPAPALDARCEIPGVAGAWSFTDAARRITVTWLDEEPLAVVDRVPAPSECEFAGPLETITPWQWDWFDR
jgi:hypothetical protein